MSMNNRISNVFCVRDKGRIVGEEMMWFSEAIKVWDVGRSLSSHSHVLILMFSFFSNTLLLLTSFHKCTQKSRIYHLCMVLCCSLLQRHFSPAAERWCCRPSLSIFIYYLLLSIIIYIALHTPEDEWMNEWMVGLIAPTTTPTSTDGERFTPGHSLYLFDYLGTYLGMYLPMV